MMPVAWLRGLLRCAMTAGLLVLPVSGQSPGPGGAGLGGGVSDERRLVVVYREGRGPVSAEGTAGRDGERMLRRHLRLGTAVVRGGREAEALLRADPDVAFVVEDRMVSADRLEVAPGTAAPMDLPRLAPSLRRMALPPDPGDSYFTDTPQGWPVRAVGGYGGGVGGEGGPWSTTMGRGVRIAVLDSGVDRNHPDIAPNLLWNRTEVDRTSLPSACDDGSPQDQSGHGTWVASLAAGAAGSGTGRVVRVAPAAGILNIKVLQRMPGPGSTVAGQCMAGQAAGLLSWVLQGIDDAVAQRADVIVLSMSMTLDLYSGDAAGVKASFDRATHAASAAGAIVVAAAGNEALEVSGGRYVVLPAQARDVLAVVASTNDACREDLGAFAMCVAGAATLPYYSNRGAALHAVAAPGGSYPRGPEEGVSGWVRGACSSGLAETADGLPGDAGHSYGCFNQGHARYVEAIGTSASAPLAAGVVALVRAAHPDWTVETVVAAVRASAVATASMPYGVVHAAAALAYVP